MPDSPDCPYCGGPAAFLPTSTSVYGRDYGPIWICHPCDAWVGCHKGTASPLGRLADKALRKAKVAAHAAFDPLWKAKMAFDGINKSRARGEMYLWLAERLSIDRKDCHIGMFDAATCQRVVEVCRPHPRSEVGARGESDA